MLDLYPAALLQLLLSVGLGLAGLVAARQLPRPALGVLAVMCLAGIGGYVAYGRDTGWWARVLPASAAIVLHNPTPPLAAFLAGVILGRTPDRRGSRGGRHPRAQRTTARTLALCPGLRRDLGLRNLRARLVLR